MQNLPSPTESCSSFYIAIGYLCVCVCVCVYVSRRELSNEMAFNVDISMMVHLDTIYKFVGQGHRSKFKAT